MPRCSVSAAHSAVASRSRRGRNSSPTSAANVCSAGPPAARRRRNASPERDDIGQPVAGGRVDDVVYPALDQRQDRLEAGERGLLRRCVVGREDAFERELLHRLRVARIDLSHRLFYRLAVDLDPGRVGLDRTEDVPAQPRHVPEEALVRGFPQSNVQAYFLRVLGQSLAVRGDVRRYQRGLASRSERQTDVAGREHLAGKRAERLTELSTEECAAERGDHRRHRAELVTHLLRHDVAHRGDHAAGDRVAQLLPDRQGIRDPLGAGPCGRRRDPGRQCRAYFSSQRSAKRSVSVTAVRSAAVTPGLPIGRSDPSASPGSAFAGASTTAAPKPNGIAEPAPPPVSAASATWRASSQFTGPSDGRGREHLLQLVHELLHGDRVVGIRCAGRQIKSEGHVGHLSTVRGRASPDATRGQRFRPGRTRK